MATNPANAPCRAVRADDMTGRRTSPRLHCLCPACGHEVRTWTDKTPGHLATLVTWCGHCNTRFVMQLHLVPADIDSRHKQVEGLLTNLGRVCRLDALRRYRDDARRANPRATPPSRDSVRDRIRHILTGVAP
jgi:transcription elongation factor Elf1